MFKPLKISIAVSLVCGTAFADPALTVKKSGRAPASTLKVKSSLVPTFDVYQKKVVKGKVEVFKVKNIPLLDLGEEREVQASVLSPLRLPASRDLELKETRRRESLNVLQIQLAPYNEVVNAPKAVTSTEAFNKIPDVKILNPVMEPVTKDPLVQLAKMDDMQPNDYKLLQALIFLEIQKKYELAMGLFAELMEDPEHRIQALYNYAMTAKGMGLNSEFRQYMIQLAQETKDKMWQQKATEALVKHINVLETSDIALIDPLVIKYEIDVTKNEEYQLTRAKHYSDKGQLGLVEDALMYISEKSPLYPDSLLLTALFNYRQGKVDDATIQLEKLMAATDGNKTLQLRSVAALTLARIQFQKGDYKDAFQSYLKVDKSNPLWLQAMVESAWTQILGEDYEGAAGNMFSLHTDFFKNAFSPESYVVRTVGYLNLCQYGDGVQVLNEMNKKYAPWKKKLEDYQKAHKDSLTYYDTVKNWIKNSDLKEVDGLPRSFIVELARHPAYMSVQKQINAYEDEIVRFNKIALTLIKMERELIAKQNEANKDLASAKKGIKGDSPSESAIASVQEAEKKLLSYRIQYHIAKKARVSIKNLRSQGIARIEKEKSVLRAQASQALAGRFNEMLAGLNKVLDQNEVLQYELYSGAGEHLRYQMAGGDVNEKERPELKVQKEKSLNWKFKGEIWEDEVGHYRSSLKNVCPQENGSNGGVAGLSEQ
ncbi:tetratricopeptide repeat protein [Bdellovibrio sp. HCB117]|uniref:tetratricopeptide repeat protein n=1 Tax=Bdellovibrio sp. HCB117 TaxID=3394359 RepID=UPI0039B55160